MKKTNNNKDKIKKSEKLYQGITRIDDNLIEEANDHRQAAAPAAQSSGKRFRRTAGALAAACLCLLLSGAFILFRMSGNRPSGETEKLHVLTASNSSSPTDDREGGETAADTVSSAESSETREPEHFDPAETSSPGIPILPITLAEMSDRPLLTASAADENQIGVTPSVEPYTIEPDLSNVTNLDQFYLQGEQELLAQNGFVVSGDTGSEFFEVYENNRYAQVPSFVTVDSMMHTYHLYFSYLLRNLERNYLSESLTRLSRSMLDNSISQYEQLKGSEWEEAAVRNVAFFTVGASLLDDTVTAEDYAAETVRTELDRITRADSTLQSSITGEYEDYTQYIPRGYYEGDEALENYFRAMMWYGRTHFTQEKESLDRSALLITLALSGDAEAYRTWEAIYAVTSFFAGASDDLGVCEYAPVICSAYGNTVTTADLPGSSQAFEAFHAATAQLPPPALNSIPIEDGQSNTVPGFRFMGQRFTIDATIMQNLIYSNVKENGSGDRRMLPDVLDVPAALGSDLALDILRETGATDYKGYTEKMEQLRSGLSQENKELWSASLYSCWLNTLRPLLEDKGEGYPVFMQSKEWAKKNLECFAGSFAELKHDTVLYTKQAVAEMGGWWDENIDDRGYVEPEPLVYARFASLADLTAQGLKEYGILSQADEENLSRLSQMAHQLLTISNKELQDETLTEEEYEFIRAYGGNIEHFWYESVKESGDSEWIDSSEAPAPVVVDIATDPAGGQVLEAAVGQPQDILVIVRVDGKIKIARGSVYSFYQFPWPSEDRLTDAKWRYLIGCQPDEDGNYNIENPFEKPAWTESYRYEWKPE